jgi:hypothetical protein
MTPKRKLHEPVLDPDGKPYSPNQVLALDRAELVRQRIDREAIVLAEYQKKLIPREAVILQASAMFAACRQKLLLIPRTLCHKLVGKDHREICDIMTVEIHKALHEMANFDKEVIRSDWKPGSNGDPFKQTVRRSVKRRTSTTAS